MTERSEGIDPTIIALDAYFATTTYGSARRQVMTDQAQLLELELAASDLTNLPERQRTSVLRSFRRTTAGRDTRSESDVLNAYIASQLETQKSKIAARKQAKATSYGTASEEAEPIVAALLERFSEPMRGKKAALRIIRSRIEAVPHPRRRG